MYLYVFVLQLNKVDQDEQSGVGEQQRDQNLS